MRRHRGGASKIFFNRSDVCKVEQTEISLKVRLSPFQWRRFARERRERIESHTDSSLFDQDKETGEELGCRQQDLPDGLLLGSIQAGGDL